MHATRITAGVACISRTVAVLCTVTNSNRGLFVSSNPRRRTMCFLASPARLGRVHQTMIQRMSSKIPPHTCTRVSYAHMHPRHTHTHTLYTCMHEVAVYIRKSDCRAITKCLHTDSPKFLSHQRHSNTSLATLLHSLSMRRGCMSWFQIVDYMQPLLP